MCSSNMSSYGIDDNLAFAVKTVITKQKYRWTDLFEQTVPGSWLEAMSKRKRTQKRMIKQKLKAVVNNIHSDKS